MSFFQITKAFFVIFLLVLFVGCSPEVGSDEWCGDMKEKPKKDWTASETADYAKHCIFK